MRREKHMATKLHHTALVTHDLEGALRFYRDGLGMEVTLDITPAGDFTTLFNAPEDRLHSVFLCDPADQSAGIVELVEFNGVGGAPPPATDTPQVGFFLLSFYVDLDVVAPRLESLGFPVLRTIAIDGQRGAKVRMAVTRDPHALMVELI